MGRRATSRWMVEMHDDTHEKSIEWTTKPRAPTICRISGCEARPVVAMLKHQDARELSQAMQSRIADGPEEQETAQGIPWNGSILSLQCPVWASLRFPGSRQVPASDRRGQI